MPHTNDKRSLRALLISSSTTFGRGYLEHCAEEIQDILRGVREITFLPYALRDWDMYENTARERFQQLGLTLSSLHHQKDPGRAIGEAEAIFVGGGNTFVLLQQIQRLGIGEILRSRACGGMPYIGSSAGANVAGVTIGATNDMPIVWPVTLDALGLVSFNINPHYYDRGPTDHRSGESRAERLGQFHEYSAIPIVALYEQAYLRVEGGTIHVRGEGGARVFRQNREVADVSTGTCLDELAGQ